MRPCLGTAVQVTKYPAAIILVNYPFQRQFISMNKGIF
jgi:hypothetical protein